MTTEEKFHAAVNVIRSLPKNGSYQPSNDLMLRFYGYYKQATLGPCCGNRPGFWDVVGRAKYDAWKQLGDMSSNEAMTKYVNELHSIVETMSYSDKVANFLEAPSNELDGINFDDLELVAGDVLEKVRSQPNSPLASREGSPNRLISSLCSSRSVSPKIDDSDEEYIDTIEIPNHHVSRPRTRVDISQEVSKIVDKLNMDVQRLSSQVTSLEQANKRTLARRKAFFSGLAPRTVAFIVLWPLISSFIINKWVFRRTQ